MREPLLLVNSTVNRFSYFKSGQARLNESFGQAALITVLFFVTTGAVVAVGFGGMGIAEVQASHELLRGKKAYITEEAAVDDIVYRLVHGMKSGWSNPEIRTVNLNNAAATLTITDNDGTGRNYTINSDSELSQRYRKGAVDVTLEATGEGSVFDHALQAGYLGITMADQSKIYDGDVYSNGPVTGSGSQKNEEIDGDVTVAENIGYDISKPMHLKHLDNLVDGNYSGPYLSARDVLGRQELLQSFVSPVTAKIYRIELFVSRSTDIAFNNDIRIRILENNPNGPDEYSPGAICSGSIPGGLNIPKSPNFGWRAVDSLIDANWNCDGGIGNLTEGEKYWIKIENTSYNSAKYFLFGASGNDASWEQDNFSFVSGYDPNFTVADDYLETARYRRGSPYQFTYPDDATHTDLSPNNVRQDIAFRIYFGNSDWQKISNIQVRGDARAEVLEGRSNAGLDIGVNDGVNPVRGGAYAKYITGTWNSPNGGVQVQNDVDGGSQGSQFLCGDYRNINLTNPTNCWPPAPDGDPNDPDDAVCFCPYGGTSGKKLCQVVDRASVCHIGDYEDWRRPEKELSETFQTLFNKRKMVDGFPKKVNGSDCTGDVVIDNTGAWCGSISMGSNDPNLFSSEGVTAHAIWPAQYDGKFKVSDMGTTVVLAGEGGKFSFSGPEEAQALNWVYHFAGVGDFNNNCKIMLPPGLPGVSATLSFDDVIDVDNFCEFQGSIDPEHQSYWTWKESQPGSGIWVKDGGRVRCLGDPWADTTCKQYEGTLDLDSCDTPGNYFSGGCQLADLYNPDRGGDPNLDPKKASWIVLATTSGKTGTVGNAALRMSNHTASTVLVAPRGSVHLTNLVEVSSITATAIHIRNQATIKYKSGLLAPSTSGPLGARPIFSKWRETE